MKLTRNSESSITLEVDNHELQLLWGALGYTKHQIVTEDRDLAEDMHLMQSLITEDLGEV